MRERCMHSAVPLFLWHLGQLLLLHPPPKSCPLSEDRCSDAIVWVAMATAEARPQVARTCSLAFSCKAVANSRFPIAWQYLLNETPSNKMKPFYPLEVMILEPRWKVFGPYYIVFKVQKGTNFGTPCDSAPRRPLPWQIISAEFLFCYANILQMQDYLVLKLPTPQLALAF